MSDPKSPEKSRRSLKLLPEVLPAPPRRDDDARAHAKSARERTMSRMKQLAGAAALMSASVAACTKPDAPAGPDGGGKDGTAPDNGIDGSPDGARADGSSASDAGSDGALGLDGGDGGDAGSDAGKKKKPTGAIPPRKDPGYMVVDMLPAPPDSAFEKELKKK